MSFRLRTRLVDKKDGIPTYAYACGVNFCNPSARFEGRFIDIVDGEQVYGVMSECRHPAHYTPITFVRKDIVPPFGISSVIQFQIVLVSTPTNNCFGDSRCPVFDLVYGGGDSWFGSITLQSGSIGIEFKYTGSIAGVPQFRVIFTGCIDAFLPTPVTCYWPFLAGGAGPLPQVNALCCDGILQPNPTVVEVIIRGYTLWRYAARFVDVVGGEDVYAYAECCPDVTDCPVTDTCCGCEVSPFQWGFDVSGVANGTCVTCVNFNAHWIISYVGSCIWNANHLGICTPGPPWNLGCNGTHWILSTSTFAGHLAEYRLPVADWLCFGPNTMIKTIDYNVVCSSGTFPATITLNAV